MDYFVSIMIPVYNEGENVINCVKALKEQTCKNFEILFVDDGSTDNSAEIIEKVIADNPDMDIRLFKQINRGAAAAREQAAINAKYDYVVYHDCDDEISNDAIEKLLLAFAISPEIDATLFDLKIEDSEEKLHDFRYFSNENILEGKDCFWESLNNWGVHSLACLRKDIFIEANSLYNLYNSSDNYINNDEVIGRLCWLFCRKVVKSDAIYIYKNNVESTTKKVNKNFYFALLNDLIMHEILISKNLIKYDYYIYMINTIRLVMEKYIIWNSDLDNRDLWKCQLKRNSQFVMHYWWHLPVKWKRKFIKLFFRIYLL